MDSSITRRCDIISNVIVAGTDDDSCFNFNFYRAFAVNVAALAAETSRLFSDRQVECVPTITGSVREFYIEPMLSCIGDYDVMSCFSNQLVVPNGYTVSRSSSDGDSKSFDVFVIHDSGSMLSNYVYLLHDAETTSVCEINEYTLRVTQRIACLSNCVHLQLFQASGPAIVRPTAEVLNNDGLFFGSLVSSDFVHCVHCPFWPPQAASWIHRRRYCGWPDAATVDLVVSQGCDVVPVSHPCHKDDTSQWRLSFSRAEVVLLNSWTTRQQIVYHMLRFFVKTERLKDKTSTGDHCDRLSMYHIKTLMLWACELQPPDCWTKKNVIQLCRELLNMLGTCLCEAFCDHYFIPDCNLLHYLNTNDRRIEETVHRLVSITDVELAEWFLQRYLKRYAAYNCPGYIQQLLNETTTSAQLGRALSSVIEWRTESFRVRLLVKLSSAASDLSTFLSGNITARMCKIYDAKRDALGPLHGVFVAFVFLKCSGEMRAGRCLSNRILHVLAAVAGREFSAVGDLFEKHGSVGTETLEKLMACWHGCVSRQSSYSSPRIFTELAKAFLHLALRLDDGHSGESTGCLANVYLAILYYTSGHYQTAVEFCKIAVTKRSNHSIAATDEQVLKVNAQLLSGFDTDIASSYGLITLYDYVKRKSMMSSQQTMYRYYANFYSVKAFARFFTIKCHDMYEVTAATNVRLYEAIQHYRQYVWKSSEKLFLADILLFRLVVARSSRFRSSPVFCWSDHLGRYGRLDVASAGFVAGELSELLIQSAVRHLTAFREFQADQLGSDCVACTTDFEALNAYRCREYDRCLSLSQNIVSVVFSMKSMPRVYIDNPQLVLMDDDIASLVGLMHIIGGSRPSLSQVATQLAIALYLEIQCLLKLGGPVPSLIQALLRTQIAYRKHNVNELLTHWILGFIYRKARLYLEETFASDMSPASLRHGESMIRARILQQDNSLVLRIQTITKSVTSGVEHLRLLM